MGTMRASRQSEEACQLTPSWRQTSSDGGTRYKVRCTPCGASGGSATTPARLLLRRYCRGRRGGGVRTGSGVAWNQTEQAIPTAASGLGSTQCAVTAAHAPFDAPPSRQTRLMASAVCGQCNLRPVQCATPSSTHSREQSQAAAGGPRGRQPRCAAQPALQAPCRPPAAHPRRVGRGRWVMTCKLAWRVGPSVLKGAASCAQQTTGDQHHRRAFGTRRALWALIPSLPTWVQTYCKSAR